MGFNSRCHTPDHIAHVIGHEQGAALVERHANRPAEGIALIGEEAAQHIERCAGRLAAAVEGNEDNLVAAVRPAVP